jgi:hypothetical protein
VGARLGVDKLREEARGAMQTLGKQSSSQVYWDDLVFLEAALLASPDLAALAAPVSELLGEFDALQARKMAARRAHIQARARASVADAGLDLGIRELRNAALFLVGQHREAPAFRALFKGSLQDEIRHALKKQVEVAQQKLDALSPKLFDEAFRQAQQAALAPLIAQGRDALEGLRHASVSAAELKLDEDAWKDEVAAVRQSVYGELLKQAAQRGLGKGWAESFFDRAAARAASGASEAPTPDDPNPPADA